MITTHPYCVKVKLPVGEEDLHWLWCRDHLNIGTWKESLTLMGDASFYFVNEEDALLFKLSNQL